MFQIKHSIWMIHLVEKYLNYHQQTCQCYVLIYFGRSQIFKTAKGHGLIVFVKFMINSDLHFLVPFYLPF